MNIKDFKWTEKRFGTRFANILKKLGGLSKDGTDGSIEYKDEQGNISKLVTDSNFSSLLAKNGLIEVKWHELKNKRDAGKLIPGVLYRITDYQCTTTQENTRSAGHQFDIVLLALSENKLAEEGWAMMHDNIYDVVFNDGKTIKCYVWHDEGNQSYCLVDCNTKLGGYVPDFLVIINEINKTITSEEQEFTSSILNMEDQYYNYFQNSNLSAWKVWYCLDNDKSRFVWADDRLILHQIMISGSPVDYIRTPESDSTIDGVKYYAWLWSSSLKFTLSETPKHGDALYQDFGGMQKTGECDKVFTNGRGVIYRLIDEWNNDVGYDFKNIQFVRPMADRNYDPNGENTWVYTYTVYNPDNTTIEDCSINGGVKGTVIDFYNELYNNVVLNPAGTCFKFLDATYGCTITASNSITMLSCDSLAISGENFSIYINNKKVLTES